MDTYIFFGFMLVLAIAALVNGQRQFNASQRPGENRQQSTLKHFVFFIPMAALVVLLMSKVIDPWLDERISGENTEWVVSYIVLGVILWPAWFIATRLAKRQGWLS